MDLKVVCIVKGKYVDKNGKERLSKNYYLVFNGHYIAIKPSFNQGYKSLELVCSEYIDKSSED